MAQAAAEIVLDAQQPLLHMGELMHESWRLKRAMGSHVSTPAIDAIYERGRQAGALGGKLLGAGGGGFVLFFVAPSDSQRFQAAMRPLLRVPIGLAAPGCRLIVDEPEPEVYDATYPRRSRAHAHSG